MQGLRRTAPLLAVVLVAVGLRAGYFASYAAHPEFRTPMLDSEWFHEQALAIRAGDWSAREATFRGPLYPIFLAGIYALTGPDPAAARLVQLLLGGLTVWLVARLGRRLFGGTAGFLGALLAALYWILIYYEGELLIESILSPLTALLLLALLRADRRPGRAGPLAAGALAALFAAARPNILLFVPAAAVWLGFRDARKGLALLAGAAILLVPITVRNRVVTGEWVVVSTQGGINFYIGNHRDADGVHAVFPGLASWRNEDVERLTAARLGRMPTENEISRYWFREAWNEIAADPPRFAAGLARKTFFLFTAHEIGNNRDVALYRAENPVLSLPLVSFGLLFSLALVGFLLGPPPRREKSLLWLFVLFYGLSVALFFVCARFRVPMLVPLFPLAGRGLELLGRAARRRTVRTLAAGLLLLAAAGAATALDPFGVGRSAEGQDAFHRGNVEARLGHAEKAIEAYREAIRRSSGLAAARYHLGVVLLGEGREEEGIRELIAAMELDPKNPRIPLALGDHMERKGEAGQAETLYRRSLSVDPYFADAYAALGGLLAERRRAAEAEPFFRRALEIEPESPAALVGLGKLLGEAGRTGEAAAFLERGVRAAPDWRDAWFEWGGHLFRAGRPAEAAGAFEKAARLEPRDVPSRMNLALARRASGDVGGAIAALREVLSIEPENETARRRLEDLE